MSSAYEQLDHREPKRLGVGFRLLDRHPRALDVTGLSISDPTRAALASASWVGGSVAAFLVVFQPFGIDHGFGVEMLWVSGFGAVAAGLLLVNELAIRPLLRCVTRSAEAPRAWQIWTVALLATGMVLYRGLSAGADWWHPSSVAWMVVQVGLVGLVPGLLKRRWRPSRRLSADEENTADGHRDRTVVLRPQVGDTLTLNVDAFAFAEASGNYVEITVSSEAGGEERHLLRLSTQSLIEQLPSSCVRTHRSFVVNLDRVRSVRGNAQGLYLDIGDGLREVPVSRSHVAAMRERLRHRLGGGG
ncbi:MAG: LytTR family DNA-binding domain-containing protein [Bacteroidota bacterium]